jgi:hypothetical protein
MNRRIRKEFCVDEGMVRKRIKGDLKINDSWLKSGMTAPTMILRIYRLILSKTMFFSECGLGAPPVELFRTGM